MSQKTYVIIGIITALFCTGIFLILGRHNNIIAFLSKDKAKEKTIVKITLTSFDAKSPNVFYKTVVVSEGSVPIIEWKLSHNVKNVRSYVLGMITLGGSFDEPTDYVWQVMRIPSSLSSITYGIKPDDAIETIGPAKKLTKGNYALSILAYGTHSPAANNILGAGWVIFIVY